MSTLKSKPMTPEEADTLFEKMRLMSPRQLVALWKLAYLMMGQKYLEEYVYATK